MLFLLNNPAIAFIIFVVIGFTVLMGTKLFEEIKLNNALSLKQKQMRISNPAKSFKSRVALLSSAALAPVVAVVIVMSIALNPQIAPNAELIAVESADDVFDLYTTFQDRMNSSYDAWSPQSPLSGNILFDESFMLRDSVLESVATTYTGSMNDLTVGSEPNNDVGSTDYSDTNVQVVGVDEMDNVLTDGKYIYTMYENKVQITLAYTTVDGPEVLDLYKTFEFNNTVCEEEQFHPQGMYVDDDYLVIIGNQYNYDCDKYEGEEPVVRPLIADIYYWYSPTSTHIKVLVFDKSDDFELQDEYKMNGYFTGTRKIGNNLYIITNNYIPFSDEDVDVDEYLPQYEVNGQITKAKYEDIVYIDGSSPNSFTTFYGIDLDTTQVDMETVLGDNGFDLYVSNENIYLVGAIYYFLPMVDFIEIEEPVNNYKTAIMKVSIDDGDVEYSGTGLVEGHTLNQFSMDEYNGNLRITTTTGWWGEDINNRLYILDEDLKEISVLENLGKPGESIKSTRFAGDYAYLVTFRQTDPFYVINVANPSDPFVEGELLIPGFSSYLQPLGPDYMLGVGFGDKYGGTNGLKISIYDVSDKANPVVFDEVIFDYEDFGWGNSTVTYNHKDLLVSLDKGILAFPFSTNSYDDDGWSYDSGIIIYNIDFEDGFTFNGYVTHNDESDENVYVYKSKFIDDYFYTISNEYIKVSTLLDPEAILYSTDLN